MAESKTLTINGRPLPVVELEIRQRKEAANEYELEDGAIIRVANPTLVVYRVENSQDAEGYPNYLVKNGVSVVVVRGPKKE